MPLYLKALLYNRHLGGVTLFRAFNVQNPAQVRALASSLQEAAATSGQPPLLICADQEGGTLLALAGTTPFPGNMALGATRSPDLARKVGYATGLELAAMGINVNYAPVCDVNVNPRNPVIGTRSFGEDPALVGQMAAALIAGLQEAGIAATAKHFPGHGDTAIDSHWGTPVLPYDEKRLRSVEIPPFASAVSAGVKLVMTAHIALPALDVGLQIPATLSSAVLQGLLRDELGFEGLIVSDAMDMGAISQGPGLLIDSIAAARAGVDLLLLMDSGVSMEAIYSGVLQAARRGLLPHKEVFASARRVLALKDWIAAQEQPSLAAVGCADHRALAYEVAAHATTLVRDRAGLLPLDLSPDKRILAVVPLPGDLTPADTSSYESVALAEVLRRYHPNVDQADVPLSPEDEDIAAITEQASGYDLVIAATINAFTHPGQVALVEALQQKGSRVILVPLRLPYDAAALPAVPTCVCTYSLQPPSLQALADALFGRIAFSGQLPVTVEGAE